MSCWEAQCRRLNIVPLPTDVLCRQLSSHRVRMMGSAQSSVDRQTSPGNAFFGSLPGTRTGTGQLPAVHSSAYLDQRYRGGQLPCRAHRLQADIFTPRSGTFSISAISSPQPYRKWRGPGGCLGLAAVWKVCRLSVYLSHSCHFHFHLRPPPLPTKP
jgi:hypothetical protein